MKIIEYSIKNRVVIVFATLVLTIAGIFSYFELGKLEDPEFKVKEAIVVTLYPGASPESVEQEVTDKIEIALRKIPNADVDSVSKAGYSEVHIKIDESTPSEKIDQQWDIVRKKINDVKTTLPLGALPPVVLDDYGDVYGMFFAITSEGFSKEELYNYAKDIRKELEKTSGVAKTTLFGNSDSVIEVLVDKNKIANLGINEKMIALAFTSQNIPAYANSMLHGDKNIRFDIDQSFESIEDIENLVIYSTPPVLNVQKPTTVLLKDIAEVRKTEVKPYTTKMRYNGKEAIGLMLSPVTGTNVVETGKEINKKIELLKQDLPYGIEIEKVYYQPELVSSAINQFIINLIESVVVVVGVLLITMGIRSGLIIGSGLILSILGTLIAMLGMKIDLQRVSLGAFIIAMGMLVDNSIVVVDGVLDSLDSGNNKYTALTKPTEKTAIPLLGATFIAIIAFLPMYLMPTTAGEYIKSLFWVVAVSLGLSWVISLTQTTVFCDIYLSENNLKSGNSKGKLLHDKFSVLLEKILTHKKFSILILLGAFFLSILLFIKVPFSFFPDSDKKGFVINLWNPEGTDIEYTNKISEAVENEVLKQDGIISVTSAIGASPSRYYIATIPELPNTALSQLIISVKKLKNIDKISETVKEFVDNNFPDTRVEIRKYANGMPTKYPIQLRIIGNDPSVLREYSKKFGNILRDIEGAENVQTDWKEKQLVIKPELDKVKERESLVTALDIATSLSRSTNGIKIGTFKDGEENIPVMFKEKNDSREFNMNSLGQVPVWGLGFKSIPFRELIRKENLIWENPIIIRKDGFRAIQVQADVKNGYRVEAVRKKFAQAIKESKIELPKGYKLEWSGEFYEQEKNTKEVISYVPLQLIIMFMTCVLLFGNLKDPIIIFGVLPLSFIGILPGLFITGRTFGFMAIIGTISLSGMMIKSAIVLIDEIRYEIYTLKKEPFKAIIDSSASRIRAVSLAAGTTVLGMTPLMFDPLFSDMAITIVFGLTVTTLLILFVVPLLYSIFYKIDKPKEN